MINGLGLLGIRKEAGAFRAIRQAVGPDKADDVYQVLLRKAQIARNNRKISRANAVVNSLDIPVPVGDVRLFDRFMRVGDQADVIDRLAKLWHGRPTPDYNTLLPGKTRKITKLFGNYNRASPRELDDIAAGIIDRY